MGGSPVSPADGPEREASRGWRRCWRAAGLFLEVIGLRTPRPRQGRDVRLSRFRQHYAAFRRLLEANDSFLRGMADVDEKQSGGAGCEPAYVREAAQSLLADVRCMIESLNAIAEDRYRSLWPPFETIRAALAVVTNRIDLPASLAPPTLVADLATLGYADLDRVGAKMANLGEIHNHVGLPTPDGFALTAHAYRRFIAGIGLDHFAGREVGEGGERAHADRLCAAVGDRIQQAEVPEAIRAEILAAYDRLAGREGRPCRVAVRSSALGEDGLLSFAGQFETVLDVDRDGLVASWRRVAGSLYGRAAVHYRQLQHLPLFEGAMPVGFVRMVDAIAGGIVYSRDPARIDRGQVIVQAGPGLGTGVTDGSTIPQTMEVVLGEDSAAVRRPRSALAVPEAPGYPDELTEELENAAAGEPQLLTDAEAEQLARWARKLEAHFGGPQDVEWAMDGERRLFLLQSRPLELAHYTTVAREPVAGASLLLAAGEVVCPGVGSGVVVHFDEASDFAGFPAGGVLVVKRPSPRYVQLMNRTAAIVADTGSTTGHMASLARELRIPTLLGTREATKVLRPGQPVTVDAFAGHVYAGVVEVPVPSVGREARVPGSREFRARWLLRRAAAHIVPLRLTDPRAPEFRPEGCTTLHDITRFVHERSYEEMFRLGETLGDLRGEAYYLDVFLPVDLYIVDLGGGIAAAAAAGRIKPGQVTSTPLAALITGMLHPKIPRWGARPLDVGGFAQVVLQHAIASPEQERSFRDPSYALVSDRYLNYTARVGYHFSIVDAYCGDTTNKNYIHLLFRGGAADSIRRGRRARAIAGILREWGFAVEVAGDSTSGRMHKMPCVETERLVEQIGRLLQFMRQMDVAMTSEGAVEAVKRAFLAEDYALTTLAKGSPVTDPG